MSFDKLDVKELRRTAIDDFAVEVADTDSKKVVAAALLESGVTFEMYLEANPHQREKFAPETVAPAPAENVVTADTLEADAPVEIVTKEEHPKLATTEKYLIKMVRQNPLFEVRGHKFTQTHPYVLMSAEDAQAILSEEEGFRQAFPQELQEFYS